MSSLIGVPHNTPVRKEFAFVLENNEARQAVAAGMTSARSSRPINTDAIQAEISQFETEKRDLSDVDTEIDRFRDHKQSFKLTISQLQRVLQFNEEMLKGDSPEFQQALQNTTDSGSADEGPLTDQPLADEDETTVCWTCGSEVERETPDSLRSLREEKSHERNDPQTELDELTTERSKFQTATVASVSTANSTRSTVKSTTAKIPLRI